MHYDPTPSFHTINHSPHSHSDTRFINMTTPWVKSGGDNFCANNATAPLNCFNPSQCTYNYNQPNGNFSCPCALSQAVELTAAFKKQVAVPAGRKVVLAVAVTSTAPSLPTGTPALAVTLPAGGAVVYKTARASPLLKPKTKPTQTGSVLTWTPAPVPVGQKTAKRNTRTYRYIMRVSKTAAAGTYIFPVAFQILDANGLILEQVFAEATVRFSVWQKQGIISASHIFLFGCSFVSLSYIHSSPSSARLKRAKGQKSIGLPRWSYGIVIRSATKHCVEFERLSWLLVLKSYEPVFFWVCVCVCVCARVCVIL